MWVVSTGFNCCFVETREKMQMPTLELEKLGVVDISNDVEALDQTIGGGPAASATLYFMPGTRDELLTRKQTYTIIGSGNRNDYVSIRPDLYSSAEYGNLKRNPGKNSYQGTWPTRFFGDWVTRANDLEFDNNDNITVKTS